MNELTKIGTICNRYNITTRTIRYYEEMGLINPTKDENNGYRYYTYEDERHLQIILSLRELEITMKEIVTIFNMKDINIFIAILKEKFKTVSYDINKLTKLKYIIRNVIDMNLKRPSMKIEQLSDVGNLLIFDNKNEIDMNEFYMNVENDMLEDIKMSDLKLNKLSDSDVKISKIDPIKVAYLRSGIIVRPWEESCERFMEWIKEEEIYKIPNRRYFCMIDKSDGIDYSTDPFSWEWIVTIPDYIKANDVIKTRYLKGGLYASVTVVCEPDLLFQRAAQLIQWIKQSDIYCSCEGEELEEHIYIFDENGKREITVYELFYPIELL